MADRIFCLRCGKKLVRTKYKNRTVYDPETGMPILLETYTMTCPDAHWWNDHDSVKYTNDPAQMESDYM